MSHLPGPPAAARLPESQDTFVPSSDNGLLLFTGNPITAEEEAQFIDSAARVFFGPAAITKSAEENAISRADSLTSSTATLTPTNFAVAGVHGIAFCPLQYDSSQDSLYFNSATFDSKAGMFDQSRLCLWINMDRSNPGSLYTILFRADADSPQPKFEITLQGRLVQTVSGTQGANQFAYAFSCSDSDVAFVNIYCSVKWAFKSATLISMTT